MIPSYVKQTPKRPAWLRSIALAFILVAASFALSETARAGTYTITQAPCQGSGWSYGGENLWPFSVADNCSGHVSVDGTNAAGASGFGFWKSPILPDTAYFSGGSVYGMLRYTSGSHHAYIRSCLRTGYSSGGFGSCGGDVIGHGSVPSNTWGWYSPVLASANIAALQIDLNRSEVGGYAAINGLNMIATENTAPVIDRAVGGTTMWYPYGQWDHNGWHRGVKNMRITTTDTGGFGVKEQRYLIDGGSGNGGVTLTRNSTSIGCTFGNWYPCPASTSWVTDWDTRAVNGGVLDGPHTIVLQSTDAANNVSNTSSYGFNVDNTSPSDPSDVSGEGDGSNSWSSTNEFEIDWTNATEAAQTTTQSGVSHVVLDLAPVNPSDPDPALVVIPVGSTVSGITAAIDLLTGVTLPVVGQYRYGLGVRDLAGNWSGNVQTDSNNDPTGVTIDTSANGPALGYDPNPPAAPGLQNNGWVSEDNLLAGYSQEWTQTAPQGGAAICGYAGVVSQNSSDEPGSTINIAGPVNDWELPSDLVEGTHWVHIRSVGCNGLASTSVSSTDVKVDRSDPASYFSGVTAGRWYKDGSIVTIGATDSPSGMAPAPVLEPFGNGAYLDYSVNGSSPAEPARGGEAQVPVTGEGQKELRFAAVDLAGNRSDDTVISFGVDASNPTGYLEDQDPARPTLMRAALGDEVSGLETAVIEVQRESGGDWILLPTGLADLSGAAVVDNPKSAMASARFPDTSLPEGRYRVRVRTYDQAGNALVTDRDKNGNPLIVHSAAMRLYSGLSATLFKAKRTCKKRKGVKCVKRARGKVVFLGGKTTLNVAYKRGAVVQGFLVDSATKPVSRQSVEIYTKAQGKDEVLAGVTSTRADGSYVFKLKPGVSRSVRVYYPGTETRRDTSASVTLGTGAKLVLRVSKRRARTGQTVTFKGSVTSFDRVVPASGKIIALQFYTGEKWRPAVAIARTDSKGRFAVKYRFDGKRVKARIVFRVLAPSEDGWGHATSASRRVIMKLN